MIERVASADGTVIAYSCQGKGPAVVLIGGGLDDDSENAPLAEARSPRLTVFNFARRGRGARRDGAAYAVKREIKEVALIDRAGDSAHLFGSSSDGALALAAAAGRAGVGRITGASDSPPGQP